MNNANRSFHNNLIKIIIITFIMIMIPNSFLSSDPDIRDCDSGCGLPIYNNPDKNTRSYYKTQNAWKAGDTIHVYFINGDEYQRGAVEHYAREWERYANLKLVFHQEPKTREENTILIKFEKQKSGVNGWSYVGTGVWGTDKPSLSLKLGTIPPTTILHEFGHALGLLHEQESPMTRTDWIREKAYDYYKTNKGWTRQQVDDYIFNWEAEEYYNWNYFDPESVMSYWVPGELFKSGKPMGANFYLSPADCEGISALYPGKNAPYRFPTLLYYTYNTKKFSMWAKNGTMWVYINDELFQTIDSSAGSGGEYRVDKDITGYFTDKFTKITFTFKPSGDNWAYWMNLEDDGNYVTTYYCDPKRYYTFNSDGIIRARGMYLVHFDNRNRGQNNYYEEDYSSDYDDYNTYTDTNEDTFDDDSYRIDSAIAWDDNYVYMFNGNRYVRYNWAKDTVDAGYPKTINNSTWPGLPFSKVDAIVDYGDGNIYLFSGDEYTRFNKQKNKIDKEYPSKIKDYWPGITFNSIDAVVNYGNGKVYFFSGDEYIRFDIKTGKADTEPKKINSDTWPGLSFTKIDAAFNWKNKKIYFFCGNEYIRFDIESGTADPGYPAKTGKYWHGLKF